MFLYECRKLEEKTKEVLFSKQISGSEQLEKNFEDYQFAIAKKDHPRGYDYLRDAIGMDLFVRDKMRRRKQMESGPTNGSAFAAYGAKSEKSLSGLCGQYMRAGGCSRGDNCHFVHDITKKGSGKKGKGRGRGRGNGGKGAG